MIHVHGITGNDEQHYDLFGAEEGLPTRRTGWLDREIDWESSPKDITFRTVDLVHRKYDPQRAVFLTSDPLWMMSADASSYHYGYHDPMNMVDPWGLNPNNPAKEGDPGSGGGGGVVNGGTDSKRVTPNSDFASFWWDIMHGEWLRGVGLGSMPGSHLGGSGSGTGGGIGANGNTDQSTKGSAERTSAQFHNSESKFNASSKPYANSAATTVGENKAVVVTAPRMTERDHLINDAWLLALSYSWFQCGLGKTLLIDHRLVTFRAGRQRDFSIKDYGTLDRLPLGTEATVNFFDPGVSVLALLVGQVRVTRVGDETFLLKTEEFNFEWRDDSSWARNIGTMVAHSIMYNYNTLSPLFPFWQIPLVLGGSYQLGFTGPIVIRR